MFIYHVYTVVLREVKVAGIYIYERPYVWVRMGVITRTCRPVRLVEQHLGNSFVEMVN